MTALPILLAAMLPAVALAIGRFKIVAPGQALWIAIIAAVLQLVGLGAIVGLVASGEEASALRYAAAAAALGLAVALLVVALGH